MSLSQSQQDELVRRYRRTQERIHRRASLAVSRIWDDLGSWDEADVDRFAAQVEPVASAAKVAAATLAAGFYARMLDRPAPAIVADRVPVALATRTPFTAAWHALKVGRPFDEALSAGRSVAGAEAERLVISTGRRTGDLVTRSYGIDPLWRRVPSASACQWCRTISGQLYRTAESADFGHDRCGCTAVPAA